MKNNEIIKSSKEDLQEEIKLNDLLIKAIQKYIDICDELLESESEAQIKKKQ